MWIHIISNRLTQLYFVILLSAIFPLAAWGEQAFEDVDWGLEVSLDQMVAMAKKGQIVEIQWHIMRNILRAQASDGRIYHIRNENKGVDLRNTLVNAGVKVGKEGVQFRYLF